MSFDHWFCTSPLKEEEIKTVRSGQVKGRELTNSLKMQMLMLLNDHAQAISVVEIHDKIVAMGITHKLKSLKAAIRSAYEDGFIYPRSADVGTGFLWKITELGKTEIERVLHGDKRKPKVPKLQTNILELFIAYGPLTSKQITEYLRSKKKDKAAKGTHAWSINQLVRKKFSENSPHEGKFKRWDITEFGRQALEENNQ
jgi:repressor of nif and glnA expression